MEDSPLNTKKVILQDYTSRYDSLLEGISSRSGSWGLSSHFSEKIPFSTITSPEIASQFVDIICFLVSKNP